MCNDYRLTVDIASIVQDLSLLEIWINAPGGTPNLAAREDINISDAAPVVRSLEGQRSVGELVTMRWSWPGPSGKPVFNFRSEGREFTMGRCLILANGFYEFTQRDEPGQKRQTKWLFTMQDHPWFCIAGMWRPHPDVGDAFTMLTMNAGDDIAPFHHRQIIPLARERWADWLDPAVPAQDVLQPLPKGSLQAHRVFPLACAGSQKAAPMA